MENFISAENLSKGFKRVKRSSGWKAKTQQWEINQFKEINALQCELLDNTYEQSPCISFKLCEQGHLRLVKALTVRDMVMQHSLCNSVLIPHIIPYLIHDNGASLKDKGISFTRRRFEQHLRWYYRKYGTEGYILKIDFRKYFDNIRHDVVKQILRKYIDDPVVLSTIDKILKGNEIDISFTDDPNYIDKVFNSLDYQQIDKRLLTGKRYMAKSLGIGSPLSQIVGILLPLKIDLYCKNVQRIHCYDAYMDDRIIIHPDKKYLQQLLKDITNIANELGIFIHSHKTQIIKLSHGFTFLKTKYILTNTGKIIRQIPKDIIVRQRRKMKKLAQFVINKELTLAYFKKQYKDWRGDKRKYNAYHTLYHMDKLFKELLVKIRGK